MSVIKIRDMPRSGQAFEGGPRQPTPRCESTVQVVGDHAVEWRHKRYGEEWNRCTRSATVVLDGVNFCRRHAGERVLEQYLAGELGRLPER